MVVGVGDGAPRWREILRNARIAMGGRDVGVWEAEAGGRLKPVPESFENAPTRAHVAEMQSALESWGVDRYFGRRWVSCRLSDEGRWCIAPVRREPPPPPPEGRERRGPERMTLELAGLCVGLMGEYGELPRRRANDTLREHQARLHLMLQQVPAILWTTDTNLAVTSASGAGLTEAGVTPALLTGLSLPEQLRGDREGEAALEAHRRALNGESATHQATVGKRVYDVHVEPLRDERGAVTGVVGIAQEVTERVRALNALTRVREDFDDFIESASLGLSWIAPNGAILRANRAELATLGYSPEEYVGRNVREFHADAAVADDMLVRLARGEALSNVEARLRHSDGSLRYVLIDANGVFEGGGLAHSRVFTRDITERTLAEAKLRYGALHDPLTTLPNRAFFTERVAHAMERARRDLDYRFAVLFLDFDHFKIVNDSLGHLAGDRLLAAMARRLEAATRPGDLVARLGGDEFTVLLEGVGDSDDAALVARRIQEHLAAPFLIEGQEVFTTASIGIAVGNPLYDRPQDLLRDADIALYRAKAHGRARHEIFDVSMRDRAGARLRLDTDLRRAVARGEFELLYQPIVEIETGRVAAYEALLRWNHPERGVVMPADFVPAAEETGLIIPIGHWVLKEACRQICRWREGYPQRPVAVNVNLSARQLSHTDLVSDVAGVLEETGLDPGSLRLEITESAIMERIEESSEVLGRLRELGIQLHMDDFGTGYSSLSYLPHFPLSALKVDRSFVRRMGTRRGDLEVVRTIVALAHNLGLEVIAEGVETAVQRERLLALGCRFAQGHLFAHALRATDAEALLLGYTVPRD